jgi:hypothetical protein
MLVYLVFAALCTPMVLALASVPADDRFVCAKDAPPACESARISLIEAQSAVRAAADREALWTTAAEALQEARNAFLQRNYGIAQRAAVTAAEQARLGIAQTAYPLFQFPGH